MKTLEFYDLKTKRKFKTDKYKVVKKGGRVFAIAKSPSGIDCWRVMGR